VEPIQKYNNKKNKDDEFKATITIDGLFIPDAHDCVGIILSQLAYYDIKGLTFLGTSAWNGPGLISIGGIGAEGSIFVDTFYKRDSSPLVASFVQEFRKSYQRDPEILEALGYDGAKFIKDILQSKLISSPLQLKDAMRQVQNFQGVSGLKGFGEDGKAIRILRILKVRKSQIEQVVP
jgi:ABC-type branched-subunit amino acid transport system substrate-binding protein